jgi:hypothetical protein
MFEDPRAAAPIRALFMPLASASAGPAEVKNAWSYALVSPLAYIAWCLNRATSVLVLPSLLRACLFRFAHSQFSQAFLALFREARTSFPQ